MDSNIKKIQVTPLKQIYVKGGDVFHCLKKSSLSFEGFGEAYFSKINYNHIKGWKKHHKMIMNLIVPIGSVKFIFTDGLGDFREELIGETCYSRITVPPGIWFAFMGKSNPFSLILNISNIEHDPIESSTNKLNTYKYDWDN